jgi:integrase
VKPFKENNARDRILSPVFLYQGHSIAEMQRSFATACKRAGIFEDFTFHDLRHGHKQLAATGP